MDTQPQVSTSYRPVGNLPQDFLTTLDPNQVSALRAFREKERVWISGLDLRKRLALLKHVLVENTVNGKTTLLCVRSDEHREVLEALADSQLEALRHDLQSGITSQALAALQLARKRRAGTQTAHCERALDQFDQWYQRNVQYRKRLDESLFGELSWRQIVTKRSITGSSKYRNLLAAALPAQGLKLHNKEYWNLRGKIKTFKRLRVIRTSAFDHLRNLHTSLFTSEKRPVEREIQATLDDAIRTGRKLLCDIADTIYDFRRDIGGEQRLQLRELRNTLQELTELIARSEAAFGSAFLDESTWSSLGNKLSSRINKNRKDMSGARVEVKDAYANFIHAIIDVAPELGRTIQTQDDIGTIESIKTIIPVIESGLTEWSESQVNELARKQRSLNANNISSAHQLHDSLETAERSTDDFIQWLNDLQILNTQYEMNALSLEKRGALIENVITECLKISEALADLDAFNLYTRFWNDESQLVQSLLTALDLLDPKHFIEAFDCWYFDQVLDQMIQNDGSPEDEYHRRMEDMRAVVHEHIRVDWQNKRNAKLKSIRGLQKNLVQGIAKANRMVLSEELKILPAKDMLELFPIVLCTPQDLTEYGYLADTLIVMAKRGSDHKLYETVSRKTVLISAEGPTVPGDLMPHWTAISLKVRTMPGQFHWMKLPMTEKLVALETLSSQFIPFLHELNLFNARGIQIFSFLGDVCDSQVLEAARLPYKQIGTPGTCASPKQLTEAFIDTRKPIVLFTVDEKLGQTYGDALNWQTSTLTSLSNSGIHVINSWLRDWREDSEAEVLRLSNALINFARPTAPPSTTRSDHSCQSSEKSSSKNAELENPNYSTVPNLPARHDQESRSVSISSPIAVENR